MQNPIRSVCVYCGSRMGASPSYRIAAETLGQRLAEVGIRLIYGGGEIGLMGTVAEATLAHGGQVTGIIPRFLDELEVGKKNLTELIRTDDMHSRKQRMAELSDGFIVLPGGLGTLDETFEILTWKQLKLHKKPVIVLNINSYWDHLVHLVEHQVREGFVNEAHLNLFQVCDTIDDAIATLLEKSGGHGFDSARS